MTPNHLGQCTVLAVMSERAYPTGRVLLVDDNRAVLKALGHQLDSWGHEVETADGGREATGRFSPQHHDVVCCDTVMPDLGGLDVLASVRQRSPQTPVIMLASFSEMQLVIQALREGAFDYIAKNDIQIIQSLIDGQPLDESRPDPLRSALSRAVTHIHLVRDNQRLVTDLKEANGNLEEEREQLKDTLAALQATQNKLIQAEKAASLGILTAGVGNEINNPLSFLVANLGLLEDWTQRVRALKEVRVLPLSGEIPEILGECQQGLQRIRETVSKMRSYSGQTKQRRTEAVAVGALLEDLSVDAGPEVALSLDAVGLPKVEASHDPLRRVISSLVRNAVEACQTKGGGEVVVGMGVPQDQGQVCVEIRDTGVGMDGGALQKAFDPFYTTHIERGASGLGLSVARQLTESMGGRLELESTSGEGTVARLHLNAWTPAPAPAEHGVEHPEGSPGPQPLLSSSDRDSSWGDFAPQAFPSSSPQNDGERPRSRRRRVSRPRPPARPRPTTAVPAVEPLDPAVELAALELPQEHAYELEPEDFDLEGLTDGADPEVA